MKGNEIKINAFVEGISIFMFRCSECKNMVRKCQRCGKFFDDCEGFSCDKGHRCFKCVKKSQLERGEEDE